jgi:hypothetical protein
LILSATQGVLALASGAMAGFSPGNYCNGTLYVGARLAATLM